jgi:hypothetical protein
MSCTAFSTKGIEHDASSAGSKLQVVQLQRQRFSGRREHHPLQPCAQGLAAGRIAEHRAQVAERCAPAPFPGQQVPAARRDDVQPVARVRHHLLDLPIEEGAQFGGETPAHLLGARRAPPRFDLVAFADVVARQPFESARRVGQGTGGHAPAADRCADQVHRVLARRQPGSEHLAVEVVEDQALRPAGGAGDGTDVVRAQPAFADVLERARPGIDLECLHAL